MYVQHIGYSSGLSECAGGKAAGQERSAMHGHYCIEPAGASVLTSEGYMRRRFLAAGLLLLSSSIAFADHKKATGYDRFVKEIRHELVMLPWYGVFDNLAYKVNGYNVTLMGQVTRPTLKSDAERVVKDIEGVQTITNNIEVLPLSPNDDRLRVALFRAIYGHPALQRYAIQAVPPIHIIVKNGQVTLEGVVGNESDKNIANIQANGVSGVFSVTNNVMVENGNERSRTR
jgi:hyperosmotically inducible periplasmic protein